MTGFDENKTSSIIYAIAFVAVSAVSVFMGITYWVLMLIYLWTWEFFWSCFWYSLICILAPFAAWATLTEWQKNNDVDLHSN